MLQTITGYGRTPSHSPQSWTEILGPICEALDRRQEQRTREILAQLLAEQVATVAANEKNEELLNKPQAAALLGVRPKTVDAWKVKGILPSHKLGGRIFYKRGEILAALQAQTQPDGRRKYARRATNKKAQ